MSDERPSDVLGALPRTRPHRRSDKRPTRPEKDKPAAAVTPEAVDAVQAAVAAADTTLTKPVKAKPKPRTAGRTKAPATAAKAKPAAAKAKPPAARAKPKSKPPLAGAAKPPPPAAGPRSGDAAQTKIAAPPGRPTKSRRNDALSTAVQAAAELAEIGLTASARAIRRAVSRLPRP